MIEKVNIAVLPNLEPEISSSDFDCNYFLISGYCHAREEEMRRNSNGNLALRSRSEFRMFNHSRHEVCAVFADRSNAHSIIQIVGVSHLPGLCCIHGMLINKLYV